MDIRLLKRYRKQARKKITWYYRNDSDELTFYRKIGPFIEEIRKYYDLSKFSSGFMRHQLQSYRMAYMEELMREERFKRNKPKTIEEYVLFSKSIHKVR